MTARIPKRYLYHHHHTTVHTGFTFGDNKQRRPTTTTDDQHAMRLSPPFSEATDRLHLSSTCAFIYLFIFFFFWVCFVLICATRHQRDDEWLVETPLSSCRNNNRSRAFVMIRLGRRRRHHLLPLTYTTNTMPHQLLAARESAYLHITCITQLV